MTWIQGKKQGSNDETTYICETSKNWLKEKKKKKKKKEEEEEKEEEENDSQLQYN